MKKKLKNKNKNLVFRPSTPTPTLACIEWTCANHDPVQVTQLIFQDGLALKDTVSLPNNYLDFQNVNYM